MMNDDALIANHHKQMTSKMINIFTFWAQKATKSEWKFGLIFFQVSSLHYEIVFQMAYMAKGDDHHHHFVSHLS